MERTSAQHPAGPPGDDQGPIYVTRTFMPPIGEYMALMQGVWDRGHVTNNGPLQQQFEKALAERFGLAHPLFVVNGTIALNMAIRALDLQGEIITTAFSHPVTTICIGYEGCTPVFVDIDPHTFGIDPAAIEARITPRTRAIMATHVYGIPCDVAGIQRIAAKHGLKVIYDGAHAFGTRYQGASILNQGDVSTTSYHATKIFHTVEGGSVHATAPAIYQRLRLLRTMGQNGESFFIPGLNCKNTEMHAAMGVANLPYYDAILSQRRHQWERYAEKLAGARVELARVADPDNYNHSYFPAVFRSEEVLMEVRRALEAANIFPRRYFHPAVTELPYIARTGECPVAESMAHRVLCLPLFHGLEDSTIDRIAGIVAANA